MKSHNGVRYAEELKLEAINYAKRHPKIQTAKKYGVSLSTLCQWIKRYEKDGTSGLIRQPEPRKTYDGKFKCEVVEYQKKYHLSDRKVAAVFQIGKSNVTAWRQKYDQKGPEALMDKRKKEKTKEQLKKEEAAKKATAREKELLKELEWLRMENAYLKKLNALVQEKERLKKSTKPLS